MDPRIREDDETLSLRAKSGNLVFRGARHKDIAKFKDFMIKFHSLVFVTYLGELAQLGERFAGSEEVDGSIPLFSTIHSLQLQSILFI